jgi:SAM-dependent methyltransferase
MKRLALDYQDGDYAYVERPNTTLLELVGRHMHGRNGRLSVLDVGVGAGANARALRTSWPGELHITGIEPNPRAAGLASAVCDRVIVGTLELALSGAEFGEVDAVLLSDVLEHTVNPVAFMRSLLTDERTREALFFISVPNYAVWYNRALTLLGRFEYARSGLFDRTHLRFFTRASLERLLEHVGLQVRECASTPSLVQSLAPWLRSAFERDVAAGEHLSLASSPAYAAYERFVEPIEKRVCGLWPELLGFQIVLVAGAKRSV